MSTPSAHDLFARVETAPDLRESLLTPVRGLAFWTAVALPFLYLPLLVSGLGSQPVRLAFLAMVAINAVALWLGHGYTDD